MQKFILLTTGLILVASTVAACSVVSAASSNPSCPRLEFLYLRGSGQGLVADTYQAFTAALDARLQLENVGATYAFKELNYPAVSVDATEYVGFNNALGAFFTDGHGFVYGDSVQTGINTLTNYLTARQRACPDTLFSLAGYSQGGQVIADTLPALDPDRFLYAALLGEPKLFLPEGIGAFPDACRGRNLSSYNVWSPNCYTHDGALSGRVPYYPEAWEGKVGLWCNSRDLICGSSNNLADMSFSADGHTAYSTNGQMNVVASRIFDHIRAAIPDAELYRTTAPVPSTSYIPPIQPFMDTVILIDYTGSMIPYIQGFRASAHELASHTIAAGGRVAVMAYNDGLPDGSYWPVIKTDFTQDESRVIAEIDGIEPENESGGDAPEGLLLALQIAYDQLSWRSGATKSVVVLTDDTYHDPDRTGITDAYKVMRRSLEIDPVNTYVFTSHYKASDSKLRRLTSDTGGALYPLNFGMSDLSAKIDDAMRAIVSRPVAVLPLEHYYARPGEEMVFDASLSYGVVDPIVSYEWDLDANGQFDTAPTSSPVYTHVFSEPVVDEMIVVRITDAGGRVATMSTRLDVTNSPPFGAESATDDNPADTAEIGTTATTDTEAETETTTDSPSPDLDDSTPHAQPAAALPASPTPPTAPAVPATGSPISADQLRRAGGLLLLCIAVIITLWIRKRFSSQGAPATSVVTP
jgi:hypothetical protein